jgi:hypothetical protein
MCDSNEYENVLDPSTGLYVPVSNENNHDCDKEDTFPEVCDDKCPSIAKHHHHSIPNLSLSLGDLFTPDSACQCVNLAVLFNYNDDKNDSEFAEIFLPELKIDYSSLTKIFFNNFGKGFSPHILDKIWAGLTNFSLANIVLEKFEELNNINRDKIPAVKMIKLHKECAIKKITKIAKKVVALKLSEFTNALSSVDVREDGNICANVTFNLFFNSLSIGVKFSLRFAICDVPHELIGKLSEDNKTGFNFDYDIDSDDYSVYVVPPGPPACGH